MHWPKGYLRNQLRKLLTEKGIAIILIEVRRGVVSKGREYIKEKSG